MQEVSCVLRKRYSCDILHCFVATGNLVQRTNLKPKVFCSKRSCAGGCEGDEKITFIKRLRSFNPGLIVRIPRYWTLEYQKMLHLLKQDICMKFAIRHVVYVFNLALQFFYLP